MPSIILSDNGVSSGSAGLKSTAASDGVLVLQTTTSGGTATNAVYVDTSQRVGIGQSTPAYLLDVNGTMRLGSAGSIQPLLLRSSVTGGLLVNNTASGGAGPLIVQDNGTEVLRVTDSLVVLKGGNTSATGTGITFPAAQSASTDANTLDDYEEGSWTPSINLLGTLTYTGYRNGSYTKIGKLVTIRFIVGVQSTDGTQDSSSIKISGLPFASPSGLDWWTNGPNPVLTEMVSTGLSPSSASGTFAIGVNSNSTELNLMVSQYNGQVANKSYMTTSVPRSAYSNANTNMYISGQMSYIANA